jgi:hypothetical protein
MSMKRSATNALAWTLCTVVAGCGGALQSPPIGTFSAQQNAHAPKSVVGMWASNGNQIFGQNAKGTKTLTVLTPSKYGCSPAWGMKVDHSKNLWVACGGYESESTAAVQKYAFGSNKPAATYVESLDCGKGCRFQSSGFDVAFDSSEHLFEANPTSYFCTPSCTEAAYPVVWWNANSASSNATAISDPNLNNAHFIDVDGAGNLYVSGYAKSGTLLDEISDPTSSSPTITTLISDPNSEMPPAVYVSDQGKVLNLIDPTTRTVSQYALPWLSSESPFNVLGPTKTGYFGKGEPYDGAFNLGDKMMAIGDLAGWVDVGRIKNNRWSMALNINFFYYGILDAVYVPSDK